MSTQSEIRPAWDQDGPPEFFSCTPGQYISMQQEICRLREFRRGKYSLSEIEGMVKALIEMRQSADALQARLDAILANPRSVVKMAWKAENARWPDSSPQFRRAVRQAFIRGHEWRLTPTEYEALRAQPCTVCSGQIGEHSVGVDRLDNSRGYSIDNLRPCCGPCNVARGCRAIKDWPPTSPAIDGNKPQTIEMPENPKESGGQP